VREIEPFHNPPRVHLPCELARWPRPARNHARSHGLLVCVACFHPSRGHDRQLLMRVGHRVTVHWIPHLTYLLHRKALCMHCLHPSCCMSLRCGHISSNGFTSCDCALARVRRFSRRTARLAPNRVLFFLVCAPLFRLHALVAGAQGTVPEAAMHSTCNVYALRSLHPRRTHNSHHSNRVCH